ncbi:hypothetical protein PMAYCL1PPCAC_20717, partial [Pristionchus mayeri]
QFHSVQSIKFEIGRKKIGHTLSNHLDRLLFNHPSLHFLHVRIPPVMNHLESCGFSEFIHLETSIVAQCIRESISCPRKNFCIMRCRYLYITLR